MRSACLYAVQFADGVVKIGSSSSPRTRWFSFKQTNRSKQVRYICSPRIDVGAYRAESILLQKAERMFRKHKGYEWFLCNDFGAVENLVRQCHRMHSTGDVGWRSYIGCSPLVNRDSGAKQRQLKVGRWAAS